MLEQYDSWLADDSDVAALVMRQWLEPVEGKDAIVFPPTYAKPERAREDDWLGYNIDRFEDGSSVCQIDSVGSQANRMEPIFKREKYQQLVPQVVIQAGDRRIHLLDAGHRAADAIVRFSDLKEEFKKAFNSLKQGDAEPLAKLAPTSLVFGVWDSRDTQVKVSRIVRSVIRAFNVRVVHRSAQYVPPIDYVANRLIDEPNTKTDRDRISELGLNHAPAPWTHGGVQVIGEIRRDVALNLSALRALGAGDDRTLPLRRYILGLALVSVTAPSELSLREGCQLVLDANRPVEWTVVQYDGTHAPFALLHADALQYAKVAATEFGVGSDRISTFREQKVKEWLSQSKEDRKRSRRSTNSSGTEEDQG
jgi:CRISPR-associated protein Csb1